MRLSKTLVWLVLFAGLGTYAYVVDYAREDEPTPEELARVVFDAEKDDVQRFALLWPGQSGEGELGVDLSFLPQTWRPATSDRGLLIEGAKAGEETTWQISRPVRTPALAGSVDRVLAKLDKLEANRTITTEDRKAYGLERPRLVLVAWLAGRDSPLTLALGKESFDGASVYAQRADHLDRIYLIPRYHLTDLDKNLDDWREKRLFPADRESIGAIVVARPSGSFRLTRRPPEDGGEEGETAWLFDEEGPAMARRVAREALDSLLDNLLKMRADSFDTPAESAPEDLARPDLRLAVEDSSGHLLAEARFAAARDTAPVRGWSSRLATTFTVDPKALEPIPAAEALRDLRLAPFADYQVERLAIEGGPSPIILERDTYEDWRMTQPVADRAKTDKVHDLLQKVTGARFLRYWTEEELQQAGISLAPPAATLQVWREAPADDAQGGTEREADLTLEVGPQITARDTRFARWTNQPGAFEVDAKLLEPLFWNDATSWRDLGLLTFKTYRVQRVHGNVAGKAFRLERGEKGAWRLEAPLERAVERHQSDALFDALHSLKAESILEEGLASFTPYGAANPQLTLTIERREGTPIELTVGRTTPDGGRYAWVADRQTLYRVGDEPLRSLTSAIEKLFAPADEASKSPE